MESVQWGLLAIYVKYTDYTLPYLTFFFSNEATGQTDQPIFTHDISNNVVWPKEVPLGVAILMNKI